MKEYMICFYKDFKDVINDTEHKEGGAIKVNEKEMFRWVQLAHTHRLNEGHMEISVYSISMECDLS